jgi:hypothetical protein
MPSQLHRLGNILEQIQCLLDAFLTRYRRVEDCSLSRVSLLPRESERRVLFLRVRIILAVALWVDWTPGTKGHDQAKPRHARTSQTHL